MSVWQKGILNKEHPLLPWILLFNVIMPTLLAIYSAVASLVVEDSILDGLAIDGKNALWITIIYLLGVNTIVPIANRIADRVGYKKLYFMGILLFSLGSLGVGISNTFIQIALSRFIEGIGGGILFPVGMAVIIEAFSKDELPLALNLYLGIGFGGGMAFGALIPGYIGMYHLWQNAFFVLIPFAILGLIICFFFHEETEKVHRGRFDYFGFLFFATMIAVFLIALSEGNLKSTDLGWWTPYIVGCFVLGILCLIGTLIVESRVENPIIPLPAFKDPVFSVSCLTLFVLGMAIFSTINVAVGYMENGLLYDKLTTGANMMTYGISLGVFSVIASILVKKIPANVLAVTGILIVIFSLFLNNITSIQGGKVRLFTILFLKGAGIGLSLGPVTANGLKNLPQRLVTDGATLLTFFRQVGGTYGGAILGIFIIRRRIFHDQLFFQPVNKQLPGYKYSFMKLQNHIMNSAGATPDEAAQMANAEIIANIKRQSYIQALNDSLIAFGYIISAITVLLIIINIYNYWKARKKVSP